MNRFLAYALSGFLTAPVVHAAQVTINKSAAVWILAVDGMPLFVKGVGCNTAEGEKGEDYLLMAKEMGANAVRTWGLTPRTYFDKAQKNGLMVDAGVWFNPIREGMPDSYEDAAYCQNLKEETLAFVRKMKDHPALLFWNLGNEVFAFTQSETEKKAFGLFLEDLIQAVHKEDPNHPIVYACSGARDLPYLKAFVPSLDIVGINAYGTYSYVLQWFRSNDYDKPVVLTEYGPFGEWDRIKDVNRQPYDPFDQNKATNYVDIWQQIERTRDRSLGGFAFVLGDQRNQASLSWYNLNWGGKKRQAYWALYAQYTGKEPTRRCPKIQFLKVDKVKDLQPGEDITLDVKSSDPGGGELRFNYFITDIARDLLIVRPPRYYPGQVEKLADGKCRIRVPNDPGVYRVYATVEDSYGNVAVANRSIEVSSLAETKTP